MTSHVVKPRPIVAQMWHGQRSDPPVVTDIIATSIAAKDRMAEPLCAGRIVRP